MKNNLFLAIMALILSTSFTYAQTETSLEKNLVSLKKASKMAKHNILLVDLRTPEEFAEKSFDVKNTVNIPIETFESRLAEIPKDKKVILACRTGNKSKKAFAILEKNGYEKMVHMDGGIVAWSDAGFKTKAAAKACCGTAKADCSKEKTGEEAKASCGTSKADCSKEKTGAEAKACCSKVQ
ncbi:MAG: rhodanese-like domain-containing protein [Emticicia sp.]|nr:rhodanese-like domain-containing protein [Emticicia sp.]